MHNTRNLHISDMTNPTTKQFLDILEAFGLSQHVNVATHIGGHILDLIITRTDTLVPLVPPVAHSLVSDHFSIICQLPLQRLPPESKTVSFRKTDTINIENFKQDILQSQIVKNPPKDMDRLVQLYDTSLSDIYDTHAPLKVKVVKIRPGTEWFDDELASKKLKKRQAERIWLRSRSVNDEKKYREVKASYSNLLSSKKSAYFSTKIQENEYNQASPYKIVNKIARKPDAKPYPDHIPEMDLANKFAVFFSKPKSKR